MLVLSLNCGSSSLKSALLDVGSGRRLLDARVEGISTASCVLRIEGVSRQLDASLTYETAVTLLLNECRAHFVGRVPEAVAHRIVHGGERFARPVLLDRQVMVALEELTDLAPLHNPPALQAVKVATDMWPNLPHVAVFDTAFHATLPRRAREYALPQALRGRFGIRRFGFHGINHEHVMRASAEHLHVRPQDLRIVSCHLGSGASVTAIEYGSSVDTSMGMTPLEGLVMGTRAGDLDPGVLLHLLRSGEFDAGKLDALLNADAGLKGLTGTQHMREVEQRAAAGDESCRLAIGLYSHRVRKYIGAYAAAMGGVDVIAFSGGVGEHSAVIRHRVAQRLEFLGAVLDEDRNRDVQIDAKTPLVEISESHSRVRLLVVRSDEEMSMAKSAVSLLKARGKADKEPTIPIAVSARHAHLSQASVERLFGAGYQLRVHAPLAQTGQFAAEEKVSLLGPRGRLDDVRLIGPPRQQDQIEISRSDEFVLGIDAPVRISGDLANTPGVALEGPLGRIALRNGVICARRHIHMSDSDAQRLDLKDHDKVAVKLGKAGRELVFNDVIVRVSPDFRLELHLDTDEANAAGVQQGDLAELLET